MIGSVWQEREWFVLVLVKWNHQWPALLLCTVLLLVIHCRWKFLVGVGVRVWIPSGRLAYLGYYIYVRFKADLPTCTVYTCTSHTFTWDWLTYSRNYYTGTTYNVHVLHVYLRLVCLMYGERSISWLPTVCSHELLQPSVTRWDKSIDVNFIYSLC